MTGFSVVELLSVSLDDCLIAMKVLFTCWMAVFLKEMAVQAYRMYFQDASAQSSQASIYPVKHTSAKSPSVDKYEERWILEDLVCPITLELPVEPVTGEDGRCVT